jgi:hypothetical protein
MTREEITHDAQAEADKHGITLVVAHNPLYEFESEEWTYYPTTAIRLFPHETLVDIIHPKGSRFESTSR